MEWQRCPAGVEPVASGWHGHRLPVQSDLGEPETVDAAHQQYAGELRALFQDRGASLAGESLLAGGAGNHLARGCMGETTYGLQEERCAGGQGDRQGGPLALQRIDALRVVTALLDVEIPLLALPAEDASVYGDCAGGLGWPRVAQIEEGGRSVAVARNVRRVESLGERDGHLRLPP